MKINLTALAVALLGRQEAVAMVSVSIAILKKIPFKEFFKIANEKL